MEAGEGVEDEEFEGPEVAEEAGAVGLREGLLRVRVDVESVRDELLALERSVRESDVRIILVEKKEDDGTTCGCGVLWRPRGE